MLPLLPILVYGALIVEAYIRPPLIVVSLSYSQQENRMAVIQVVNEGRWPVTLRGASIQGVMPPDELGALSTVPGPLMVVPLLKNEGIVERGDLVGWRVEPDSRGNGPNQGVSLIWYKTIDQRWFHCPTVSYRYLGWPFEATSSCSGSFRGPSLVDRLPADLAHWEGWRPAGLDVEYRSQQVGDDLRQTLATRHPSAMGGAPAGN